MINYKIKVMTLSLKRPEAIKMARLVNEES